MSEVTFVLQLAAINRGCSLANFFCRKN